MKISPENILKLKPKVLYYHLMKNLPYYPSNNRNLIRTEVRRLFKMNKNIEEKSLIKKEVKKASLGLAHVFLYVEKNEEFKTRFQISATNYEPMNPKDKDFVYF